MIEKNNEIMLPNYWLFDKVPIFAFYRIHLVPAMKLNNCQDAMIRNRFDFEDKFDSNDEIKIHAVCCLLTPIYWLQASNRSNKKAFFAF